MSGGKSSSRTLAWSGGPAEFLDRTEPDPVGLAKGAVDGTSFGDTHFGAVNQGRYVGGIGVAVAHETAGAGGLVDGCFKDPAAGIRVGEFLLKSCANPKAPPLQGDLKEPRMCHVPLPIDVEE